jgi:hypothetical protein
VFNGAFEVPLMVAAPVVISEHPAVVAVVEEMVDEGEVILRDLAISANPDLFADDTDAGLAPNPGCIVDQLDDRGLATRSYYAKCNTEGTLYVLAAL